MKTLLSIALMATALVQGVEWSSPIPPEAETAAPAALLPFPRVVTWKAPRVVSEKDSGSALAWEDGSVPLPGRAGWALRGATDGEMVQTAWRGLLDSLPEQGVSGELVCHLELIGSSDTISLSGAYLNAVDHLGEGYVLYIAQDGVHILAPEEAGLFYGLQTLRQLVAGKKEAPFCHIVDYPAFPVRGFHQDCGRNFQTIESLKRQIDIAAQLKLNYFHWHFTDYPAYHLESKKYPRLNAPEHRTRDKADTYTYDQVRELIAYAKARHVTIIPEIDMPGHSDYFDRAFGFEMYTEQGMKVLEDVLEEFCSEVPAEDCPIFHIGADEVSVPNAKEFVARMSAKLKAHGRTMMQWEGPWDLPVGETSIAQRWVQGQASQAADSIKQPTIDSSIGYSNLMDPALLVRRWFFMQPCGVSKGDALHLGAIFCTWPDRRVEDKSLIPLQSPQWPGMCAMAERAWVGGSNTAADVFPTDMPAPETEAAHAFAAFEKRMVGVRHTLFKGEHFPYWTEGPRENLLVGPVPMEQAEAVRAKVLDGQLDGLPVRKVYGGSLYFRTARGAWNLGMFPQVPTGHCVWVITQVNALAAGEAPFMLGFDAPLRSHQYYTGVPEPGAWSRCATRIWLNGAEIKNPRSFSIGERKWETMVKNGEIPLCNEEIWWTQPPTLLLLKQGQNTFVIEQPYTDRIQSWGVSLIPVKE